MNRNASFRFIFIVNVFIRFYEYLKCLYACLINLIAFLLLFSTSPSLFNPLKSMMLTII